MPHLTAEIVSTVVESESNIRRYRKIRRFFAGVLLHALWWDICLNRPILSWFRKPATKRYRSICRDFRSLALELGGVLIKLGQFLSIRVDILPLDIIRELEGLQDQVPPAPFSEVAAQIREDFGGRSPTELFAGFSEEAVGAASFAQVHRARLFSGETVMVKVLRPGIHALVETDLAVVRLAFRWMKAYPWLMKRVDLDWLAEEFSIVTRKELDLRNEAANVRRLASDLADRKDVYFPAIHPALSSSRTLTLEDVGYIKIDDLAALEEAGISPERVADHLYALYMRQVFETCFVHVDPHPGNLFIRPLPNPDEDRDTFSPGDPVPPCGTRPFQIVLIDFGMAVEIPERLRMALREYAVALGTSDARRMVLAYRRAGALLPHADIERLTEAHEALFQRFRGIGVGRLKDGALKEAGELMREYRDLIRDAPFQFQADMLFIVRAVGILSGLAARLNPDFDIWAKTLPYARRYAGEALKESARERLSRLARILIESPDILKKTAERLARSNAGGGVIRAPGIEKALSRLDDSLNRLGWRILASACVISAALAYPSGGDSDGWKWALGISALFWLKSLK